MNYFLEFNEFLDCWQKKWKYHLSGQAARLKGDYGLTDILKEIKGWIEDLKETYNVLVWDS